MIGVARYAHHRPEVLRLRAADVPYRAIGKQLGIGATTAWRLADPAHEEKYQAATLASRQRQVAA